MNKKNVVAEIELVYYNKTKASERPSVNSARDAYNLFLSTWHRGRIESQEEFKILLLDSRNGCMGVSDMTCGGLTSCDVDIKLIFATALKARSVNVILAHNHPSGCLEPSEDDKALTNKCIATGKVLDITILDHLVVTKEGYWSFSDKHML